MSYLLFQVYVVFLMLRPIELFELELAALRPMLMLFALTLVTSLASAMSERRVQARPVHYLLLVGLVLAIGVSVAASGWARGALFAVESFSSAAGLFILATINLTTLERVRQTTLTVLICVMTACAISLFSYHTGFLADKMVIQVSTSKMDSEPVPEHLARNKARLDRIAMEQLLGPGYRDNLNNPILEEAETERRDSDPVIIPAQEKSGFYNWRMRYLGFMSDPNDLAQAIVLVLPFLWAFSRQGAPLLNLLRVWIPSLFLGYAIILTNSRGAIIGLAALLFFGLRSILGTARTLIGLGVLGVIVLAGLVGGSRGFTTADASASERIDLWYGGLLMMIERPIFGVGFNQFTDHAPLTAHNSFVLVAAELGMLGYFFWVALLVISFQGLNETIRHADLQSEAYKLASLIRTSLTGFLTCAWFLSRGYQATLFLVLGMAVACWYCWAKSQSPGRFTAAKTAAGTTGQGPAGGTLPSPLGQGRYSTRSRSPGVALGFTWLPQTLFVMAGALLSVYLIINVVWVLS